MESGNKLFLLRSLTAAAVLIEAILTSFELLIQD